MNNKTTQPWRVGNDALFLYPDFVSGECRGRVMHNPKKGARHGQKRKRRKERKEAKERKEDKEKTIPGFITKPNISTACAYARVRGAANRLHMHVRGSGRGGDGDHRQPPREARGLPLAQNRNRRLNGNRLPTRPKGENRWTQRISTAP